MTLEEVDLVVPHQANARILEALCKLTEFPVERVFVNIQKYGNTSAASVPIALSEAVAEGRIKPGDRVLLVAFGAGGTAGAIMVQWTANPEDGLRAEGIGPESVHILDSGIEPTNPFPPALEWIRVGADSPSTVVARDAS